MTPGVCLVRWIESQTKGEAMELNGDSAVIDTATDDAVPMTPEEMKAVLVELADAKKRLRLMERRNKAIVDAERSVESWKQELDDLSARVNDTRKAWKEAVEALQREITRQERQGELPFDEQPEAAAELPTEPTVDTAAATKLADVAGLTESFREKLASIDVTIVGELEEAMREGKLVPNRVKGLGETSINKITDAMRAFREKHPVEVDSRPKRCRCGTEYPGGFMGCPTCGGTFYERVDHEETDESGREVDE